MDLGSGGKRSELLGGKQGMMGGRVGESEGKMEESKCFYGHLHNFSFDLLFTCTGRPVV